MDIVPAFLKGIRELVAAGDGETLRDWLLVEPDSPPAYFAMGQELRRKHPKGSPTFADFVEKCLPEEDDVPDGGSTPWPGFHAFMHQYLCYWRDVPFGDLMSVHMHLCTLSGSSVSALKHPTNGGIMIQTCVSFAQSMVKLVSALNSRPDLTADYRIRGSQEDSETRTFVDEACQIIKDMFSDCSKTHGHPVPGSKKSFLYLLASMALRLLFICGRPMVAWHLLNPIDVNRTAPLSLFPVAQRVTYLYYLGIVMFQSDHYLRAKLALEEAYRQVPQTFTKQRRLILTYLIPANLLSGLLPSEALLGRPEARSLAPIFRPIAAAVRKGNFVAFQHALAVHQDWLLQKNLLIPLMYRLRPLLWRCLTRRVFLLTYIPPPSWAEGTALPAGRKAVTLDLNAVHTAAQYIQHLLEGYVPALPRSGKRNPHTNALFLRAVANSTPSPPEETTLVPAPGGPRRLRAYEGMLWGNLPVAMEHVETIVMGLVAQGLMSGFVSYSGKKFAVQGIGRTGGDPAAAGWPANVAEVIVQRLRAQQGAGAERVPGWVT